MHNLGWEYVDPADFSIQPKDNKIAANGVSPHHF
jgi:hypothetical protein